MDTFDFQIHQQEPKILKDWHLMLAHFAVKSTTMEVPKATDLRIVLPVILKMKLKLTVTFFVNKRDTL